MKSHLLRDGGDYFVASAMSATVQLTPSAIFAYVFWACGFWIAAMDMEPVTILELAAEDAELSVHCRNCGHWKVFSAATIPRQLHESPVPELEGKFRCTHCGGRFTCAMPLYKSQKRQVRSHGAGWIDPPAE